MTYVGPEFYIFWYEPREKLETYTFPDGHKVRVTPPGYVKPDRILHDVQIDGLLDKSHTDQAVHIHVSPKNVNYYSNTDEDYERTKIIVEFAKLVASGVVEIREGSRS